MALLTNAIKGTQDVLPQDSYKNRFVEQTLAEIAGNYGFREIRTPVFEHTELFNRSVGDTTDVVQKEMYTFLDKGDRSITLRPEGTAGAVRAFLEHGLFNEALPQKVYYLTSCYRYEKPQAGRLREFHQFGVECFGAESAAADAEVISLANEIFGFLGVEGLELQINSIGCPTCRAEYQKALKEYFDSKKGDLCETCLSRLDRNPMRILDCKSPICSEIAKEAPVVLDFLCDDCKDHFEKLKSYLDAMNIVYKVNPTIVRGLDYYTRTVFEFVATGIGAQGTVCGGGRYDGLCEELGGNHTPALGFGLGLERLMLVLEAQGIELPADQKCNLYVAPAGDAAALYAAGLVTNLRQEGIYALFDISGRGIKAQMKYANKIGAEFVIVVGDNELESGIGKLKNMESGEEIEVKLSTLADDFADIAIKQSVAKLTGELDTDEFAGVDMSGIDINALFGGKF
ncbi:MAG: histidine--tRNA ligase [Oscillospiraceae bacterium]|nr:histidine--tRNA ligase [Candidatus Limimonas coprohippi]MCQ2487859.1 histidine--tRNA ligase [Clostridia bacterium]